MFPFSYSSSHILTNFIEKLYKMCRFEPVLQQAEIESLRSMMQQKLLFPQQLFQMLTKAEPSANARHEINESKSEINHLKCASKFDLMEILEMEDDLDEVFNNASGFLPEQKSELPFDLNETKLIYEEKQERQIKQKQFSDDSNSGDSLDEYEAELNLASNTRYLAHKYCRIHIGGTYHAGFTKNIVSKSTITLTMPILLVKHFDSSEEFVIFNCHCVMKYGEISVVFNMLKEQCELRGDNEDQFEHDR